MRLADMSLDRRQTIALERLADAAERMADAMEKKTTAGEPASTPRMITTPAPQFVEPPKDDLLDDEVEPLGDDPQ